MKRILSIILAIMLLTASTSFAAIDSDTYWKANSGNYIGTVTYRYNVATYNGDGELVLESTTKLNDGHLCAPRQIRKTKVAADAIDSTFYVTLDQVGEYIAIGGLTSQITNLRRIDLYLKSKSAVNFKVSVSEWAKGGYNYRPVYEGSTEALAPANWAGSTATDENVALYYPIVFETPQTVYSSPADAQVIVEVTGVDGAELSKGDTLPEGVSLQIAEASISYTNSKNLLDIGGDVYKSLFADLGEPYDGATSGTYYTRYDVYDLPFEYVANAFFVGSAVSNVSNANAIGTMYNNAYVYVNKNKPFYTDGTSTLSYKGITGGGWPVDVQTKKYWSTGVSGAVLNVTPNSSGACWWIGDMGKKKQAIDHIKMIYAGGKATKVEVYSSDSFVGGSDTFSNAQNAFANPNHSSWVLRGSAEDANGVKDVYIYDSEPARLWMVKVVNYDEGTQLKPFEIYIRREGELPEIIGDATLSEEVTAGADITYTLSAENLRNTAAVYFAIYEDGILKNVFVKDIKAGANVAQVLDTQTVSCTVPSELTGNLTARAFLWNKGDLIPLASAK